MFVLSVGTVIVCTPCKTFLGGEEFGLGLLILILFVEDLENVGKETG